MHTFRDGLDAALEDLRYGVGRMDRPNTDTCNDLVGVIGSEVSWNHAAHRVAIAR